MGPRDPHVAVLREHAASTNGASSDEEPPMLLTVTREPLTALLAGPDLRRARDARRQARAWLEDRGLGEYADVGELIVGELVANALCHGEGPVRLRLSLTSGHLRVEVHDGGAGRPVRKHVASDDESGRGLEVIDGLVELHGGERGVINDVAGPGKTVYVTVTLATVLADAACLTATGKVIPDAW
jgi:Histidine kinase-like ATPase domain